MKNLLPTIIIYALTCWLFGEGFVLQAQSVQNKNNSLNAQADVQNAKASKEQSAVTYGVFSVKNDIDSKLVASNNLRVDYVRQTQMLSFWDGSGNSGIDYWLTRKKKILLNINNDTTPSYFPKNLSVYKSKLQSFLDVYGDSIELAVIENEELNTNTGLTGTLYHLGSMQDYINELSAAADICIARGIPVTDGGLTSEIVPSLRHYYLVNNKTDSVNWLVQQMNGVATDSLLWKRTDSLLNAFKTIPLSYVNLHWYEPMKGMNRMSGVLQVVCNYITQQTGKKVITNETGTKSDSSYVTQLMQEWSKIQPQYCMFFDGIGFNGGQPLTAANGNLLPTGIAFRNFIAGGKACIKSITVSPAGFISACSGDNLVLTATQSFSNYQWNTGDTGRSIIIKNTGNYSVISTQKSCIAFSNSAQLLFNALPVKPVITTNPSPPFNVCPSKNVQLLSSTALTHLWSTGDTTKNIFVSNVGKYAVTISDANGCKSTSDSVNVTYQDCNAPARLSVNGISTNRATMSWDTVSCAVGYQLQYRIKGVLPWTSLQLLNGSTASRTIYGLTAAIYQWRMLTYCRYSPDTVKSVYVNGPEFNILSTLAVTPSIIRNANSFEAGIFPVPAKDFTTVSVSNVSNKLKITVTDLYGKVLWKKENITSRNVQVPVAALASGVYIVIVDDKTNKKTLRLVKD